MGQQFSKALAAADGEWCTCNLLALSDFQLLVSKSMDHGHSG
jgi:hypothetical protein